MSLNIEELILHVEGANRVFDDYEWDRWERKARDHDIPVELAALGRPLSREAQQYAWDGDLYIEYGWLDGGAAMIELALRDPSAARRRWDHLMAIDGERVNEAGNWLDRRELL